RGEDVVQLRPAVVVEELGARGERPRLFCDRVGHRRVAVPEVRRTLPADAVDVFAAILVVKERTVAAHDRERPFGVQARGVRVLAPDGRAPLHGHPWITVRTCGSPDALRITTSPTPPSIASRAARIFFFMRPCASFSASSSVVPATSY